MWRRSGELGIFLSESSKWVLLLLVRPKDDPLKYLWKSRWTSSSSFLFLETRVFLSLPSWLSSESSRNCLSRKSQIWNREVSKRATEKVNRTSRQPIKKKKTNKKKKKNVSMRKKECDRVVCGITRRSECVIFRKLHLSSFSMCIMRWRVGAEGGKMKMTGVLCRWLICNKSESHLCRCLCHCFVLIY